MLVIWLILAICILIGFGVALEKNFTQTENNLKYTNKERFLDIILVIVGVIASLCVILLAIII